MNSEEILLTPTSTGQAQQVGGVTFRKKILPIGTINYKGRQIRFDRGYLTDLAGAFHDQAFDTVPFMLAGADNAHTLDPERWRGDVTDVEVGNDGLYGVIRLTPDAAELVRKNPQLGVSARIVERLSRADGKNFPRAMQHVLGTLDPRITGLGEWQEVNLTRYDDDESVVDLTDVEFEEGAEMRQQLEEMSDEELVTLLSQLQAEQDLIDLAFEDDEDDEDDEGYGEDDGTDPDDEDDEDDEADNESKPKQRIGRLRRQDHSRTGSSQVDLAGSDVYDQLNAMRQQLAASQFESEKRDWVGKGVPPRLVDLARPLLETIEPVTLDLSNGQDEPVNATSIIREMLDAATGYIELARERGHSIDFSTEREDPTDPNGEAIKEALGLWEKQFPAV